MPYLNVNGARLYYEDTQVGEETIVFGHSLLFHLRMYDEQVKHFRDRYRCITVDFRGQGQSEITEAGYDIDTLTEDMAAVIRELEVGPCHYVGLSMGGFVGLRLALRHPELLRSLSLLDTAAHAEDPAKLPRYRLLQRIARYIGLWAVSGNIAGIMFAPDFRKDPSRRDTYRYWKRQFSGYKTEGALRAVNGVLSRPALSIEDLGRIHLPTLILVGALDKALPVDRSEFLHQHIPDSRFELIPKAGHIITVEQPEKTNRALEAFWDQVQ